MKVRQSSRKHRPVKVIERVKTRFQEPSDAWATKPWEQAKAQGKAEGKPHIENRTTKTMMVFAEPVEERDETDVEEDGREEGA